MGGFTTIWLFYLYTVKNAAQKIISFSLHRHSNSLTQAWLATHLTCMQIIKYIFLECRILAQVNIFSLDKLSVRLLLHQQSQRNLLTTLSFCFSKVAQNRMSNTKHFRACDSCHAYHDAFKTLQSKFSIPIRTFTNHSRSRSISHPNSLFYL